MNRRAIGAWVRVEAGGVTQTRLVKTGSSYLSQSEITPTFGLGDWKSEVLVRIIWPDGRKTTRRVTEVDRTIEIAEKE
jgi:predicted Zn-dependent protease